MKLTILGGGGVRTPLLVSAALRRAERIHLDEICLMDVNARKLELIGSLCREILIREKANVRISLASDPIPALEGAGYVITTIRVGEEAGRVLDERIALKHGVLGQETTGPGGFAMALRSIPAILSYAQMLEEASPGAWMFNFTNPAGLVTQALHENGFTRSIGICDSANGAQHAVARWLGVDPRELRAEVFGLNHLSWTRRVLHDGTDVLKPLLTNAEFLAGSLQRMFDPHLVQRMGMFLNEYLYYYYYREQALAQISAGRKTRGEEVAEWNRALLEQLESSDPEHHPQAALEVYLNYNNQRTATYMNYATDGQPERQEGQGTTKRQDEAESALKESALQGSALPGDEGYAGVALSIMEAFGRGEPLYTALNVPNAGAIEAMQAGDVVEVSCRVDREGVHPLPIGEIPEPQELLMRSVKLFEHLTVAAIGSRSREMAVFALMNHPLVQSHSLATALVDEYLAAHAAHTGEWH